MAQGICERCGDAFHYESKSTGLFWKDMYSTPRYCYYCREFRDKEFSRAVEKAEAENWYKHILDRKVCIYCNGEKYVGKNRQRCEHCNGEGWTPKEKEYTHPSFGRFVPDPAVAKFLPESYDKIPEKPKENSSSDNNSGSFCYITTACAMALGLPDNCEQLQILRNFRDGFVKKQSSGLEDVAQYYTEAPKIVKAMSLRQDASKIYQRVYENIRHALNLIQRKDLQGAYRHYKKVCLELKSEFG